LRVKAKGFSIVYIPSRGQSRSFHLSAFIIYIALLFLFGSSFFVFQFYINLNSLKTNYVAMTTMSEEEKQQIMSEELSVIQQEIAFINEIHISNREKMTSISNSDKEVRVNLGLRENDLNPDKFLNKNNKNLSYSGSDLSLVNVYKLKERVNKQEKSLQVQNRNLEIGSISANDFNAEVAKTPEGYPCPGYIDPGFGWRTHPIYRIPDYHKGVDISARYGFLKATGDGRVTAVGWAGGYGKMVTIYHREGISTLYGHCSETLVKVGQYVKKGTTIALAGATGDATESHVHYEVIRDNTPINPEEFNREIDRVKRASGRK
jgi:murein DD-endopeptidase MepM/ murein hydrolase activator NlpD